MGIVKIPLNILVCIFLVNPNSRIVEIKKVSPMMVVVYFPLNRKSKTKSNAQIRIPIKEKNEIRLMTFSSLGKSDFVKISTKLIPKNIVIKTKNPVIFQICGNV